MADEIHVNDIGTEFRILISDDGSTVDLSAATDILMIFKKPSGSRIERNADFYTDGTDGLVYYRSVEGDLDEVGTYKIQANVSIGGGVFNSSVGSFKVHHNI